MSITPTNRVKWKNILLGDHAFISISYSSNLDIRTIPRAKGVLIKSTKDLGGGHLVITVSTIVAKANRTELETYFGSLDSTLDMTDKGDLVVQDGNGTTTFTDCYLESFDQSGEDQKVNNGTFRFIKSL